MMNQYLGSYQIVSLKAGPYTAQVIPELGGQLIALEKGEVALLHAPESEEQLKQASTSYGLPILFPPNRIDGGHFKTKEREYQFPVNEPARNNSLHGFLHKRPWQVKEATDHAVTLCYEATPETDFYAAYPHTFQAVLQYELSSQGLKQTVTIRNTGLEAIPLGLGFHSAFAVDPQSRIHISVKERILMSERMLPTGQVRPLNEQEQRFRAQGLEPDAWSMDDHYTAEPLQEEGRPFHGAIIDRANGRVYYEVDPFYRHWMIWNANREGSFICLEPQNWRVNAPNLAAQGAGEEETGFCMLPAGESLTAWAKISYKARF